MDSIREDPESTLLRWRGDKKYNIGAAVIREIQGGIHTLSLVEQEVFLRTLDDFLLNGSWDNEGYYLDNRRGTERISVRRQKRLEQSKVYRKVLTEHNWCPSTVELLLKATNIPGLSLGAVLIDNDSRQWHDHNKKNEIHTRCTVRECKALHVPEGEQDEPLHTNECTGQSVPCSVGTVNQEELLRILSMPSDPIPLVRLPLDDKEPSEPLSLVQGDASQPTSTPFIAISYVWQQRRLMPWCQLRYIARKVREYTELENIKASDRNQYEVWLDVLCIPQRSTNEDINRKRKRAMGRMQNVYGEAGNVLVFDKLLENSSKKATATATGIKIIACDWMRRLWTMQEAMVSTQKLVFVMSDGFLPYQELMTNLLRARMAEAKGNCRLSSMVWSALLPLDAIRAQRSDDNTIRGQRLDGDVQRWKNLLSALEFRSTSRKEDEPLCMASVLLWGNCRQPRWDKLPARQNQTEEHIYRMKELFQTLESFPLSVIFCGGRRVDRTKYKNFGWMPESYISRASERRMNVRTRTANPNIIAQCTEEGLRFRSDGDIFMLSPPTAGTVHGTIHLRLHENATGYTVLKRFAKSQWEINDEQRQVNALTDGNDGSVDDGWQRLGNSPDGRPLALITNDASDHDGIVVLVESWLGSSIVANFICQVFVGGLNKEESDLIFIDPKEADNHMRYRKGSAKKYKQSLELHATMSTKSKANSQSGSNPRNNQSKPEQSAKPRGLTSNWRSQQSEKPRDFTTNWRSQQSEKSRDLTTNWRPQQPPDLHPPRPASITSPSLPPPESTSLGPPELSKHRQWVPQLLHDEVQSEDNIERQQLKTRKPQQATGCCLQAIDWLIR